MSKNKFFNPMLMATLALLGLLVSLTGLYQQAQAKQAVAPTQAKTMIFLVSSAGDGRIELMGSLIFTPTDISLSSSTVPEHEPGGTLVGTFSTVDLDSLLDETHTYSLASGEGDDDNDSFIIPAGSNELRTAVPFDHEARSSYSVRVRSTGNTDGFFLEKSFIITVSDVNEAPSDISLDDASVPENRPINTVVGIFSTTDPDTGQSHTYSLVSGEGSIDNSEFKISGNRLRTNAVFDYQARQSYSIRVRTTDKANTALTFEKIFTITVIDVLPKIRLTKTTNPSSVRETGGNVTFTFQVDNTGQENITLNSFSDNKFGLATRCHNAVGTLITPGNNYTCTFTEFISGDFKGSAHRNTARAVVEDNENQTQEDIDSATVDFTDVMPNLSLAYTSDPSEVNEQGDRVTFSILVTNLGTEMGMLTLLQDSTFGNLNGQGSCVINVTIAPKGGTYSCSFNRPVSGRGGTDQVYTTTARLADNDGNTKDVSDNAVVTIGEPSPGGEHLIIYLPIITKSPPTDLFIENDTGGVVDFAVVGTGVSCRVPAGQQNFFCGSFPPGIYSIQVSSICGNLTTTKTYASGPQSTRISCK